MGYTVSLLILGVMFFNSWVSDLQIRVSSESAGHSDLSGGCGVYNTLPCFYFETITDKMDVPNNDAARYWRRRHHFCIWLLVKESMNVNGRCIQ